MIQNYDDFIETLLSAGFSMGGPSADGIYAILNWAWNASPPYETPVRWYTGNPVTDPNEWISRILNERSDIAYGKVFNKKIGYVTKKWFPYFFAVRRGDVTLDEAYKNGTISHFARRIYDVVNTHETILIEEIKRLGGFSREDKSGFDRALTDLQMKMYILHFKRQLKVSKSGEEYGMASTVFCTTERFWGDDMLKESAKISKDNAVDKIRTQILKLNPAAQEKQIVKFIHG